MTYFVSGGSRTLTQSISRIQFLLWFLPTPVQKQTFGYRWHSCLWSWCPTCHQQWQSTEVNTKH